MKWTYIDTAYDSIVKKDKLFSSVDRTVFRKEMLAVRMEIFALVLTHKIRKEEIVLNQSLFTKDYLSKINESELWDIMGEYNQAIARSMHDLVKGERLSRANDEFIDNMRLGLFEDYVKKYRMDKTCIARVCNRVGSEVAWEQHVIVNNLSARLASRVNCSEDINAEALIGIPSVIWGFYQGAKEAIKSVSLG
jgi:hypothetical protein